MTTTPDEGNQRIYARRLLYHFPVHPLAQRLLLLVRQQNFVRAGDRLAVAVSGGADSVALLRLLLDLREEIGMVLSVAHVNHKLRGPESDRDADFVASLANQYQLDLHQIEAPVVGSNLEASARKQRYLFFQELAREGKVSNLATAHTLDDQAETVMLRIFRGTGIRGLAGIHTRIAFEEEGRPFGEIVRPLLGFRRSALRKFLNDYGQSWLEDSSNSDLAFDRNRVRHGLLPVITAEFGSAAIEHMAELAEIARAEDEHWKLVHPEVMPARSSDLAIDPLLHLPIAGQRRLIRHWLEMEADGVSISFRLIEEALHMARDRTQTTLQISAAWALHRDGNGLRLRCQSKKLTENYRHALPVTGTVSIPEIGSKFEASEVEVSSFPENLRCQLLDIQKVPKQLLLRNWIAGDRYWPATSSSPKKIKELLTDRKIKGANKTLWPVAESEADGVIWMRGFAVAASFQVPKGATKAIWIQEFPESD